MDAYQHFNLSRSPFEPVPDADFFYEAPNHAEVLATAQYVVLSRKRCCVVVGESGLGKTLIARIVAQNVNQTVPVFWIHGGAQSDNETRVRIYPPRTFNRLDANAGIQDATLTGEIHVARFLPDPPLLIVDAAHELPEYGWRDVEAWLSNEVRYPKPVNVLIFGLPGLLDSLARPAMDCIRQRIFRACRLEPLSDKESINYIRFRMEKAGCRLEDVFTKEALLTIVEAARGYPAQINKLCDNAMIEAYGAERGGVTETDVNNALRALFHARWYERQQQPCTKPIDLEPPTEEVAQQMHFEASLAELGLPISLDESMPLTGVTVSSEPLEGCLKRFKTRLDDALKLVREVGNEDARDDLEPAMESTSMLPEVSSLIESWRRQSASLRENHESSPEMAGVCAMADSA